MNNLREFQKYRHDKENKNLVLVFFEALIGNHYLFDILRIWNAYENVAYYCLTGELYDSNLKCKIELLS